jgi:hypothetical protein
MSRRGDPEKLYIAHRIALVARLVSSSVLEGVAERYVASWEAEARLRGFDGRTPGWWTPAWDWIEQQRHGA